MILISVNAGFAKTSDDRNRPNGNPTAQVWYPVVVHFASDQLLCNVYLIEIIDAMGIQVAPAQVFVPGTTTYKFFEQTRISKGVRIARLVKAPYGVHYICPIELVTAPDVKVIEFKNGNFYRFDLYPKSVSIKESIK